ncbi:MAG: porin [Pseudomonadota bacterium]
MKKVLLATTALVATAGASHAEVALSGIAELGFLVGSDDLDPADGFDESEFRFHTDIDVTFTLSGTTDNGLTFGATIDLDESDDGDAFDADTQGGETIFISGNFGSITGGDTDGAFDWALTELNAGSPGSIDDGETEHDGYSGNAGLDGTYDGQIIRYEYSFQNFGVAFSAEIDDSGDEDAIFGIGARYGFDFASGTINFGAGYQDGDSGLEIYGGSISAVLDNGLTATVNYSEGETEDGDFENYGIGLSYEFDAFSVHGNYANTDTDSGDDDGFGFAAAYDLGGGASVHFGFGTDDTDETYSFGVAMSF